MKFGESIVSCVQQYARFNGRSPRSEYWYWVLFTFVIGFAAGVADVLVFGIAPCADFSCIWEHQKFETVLNLLLFLPTLGVSVRRLHDVNRSGWWLLTILPPLYWVFVKGTAGSNDFGGDPLVKT